MKAFLVAHNNPAIIIDKNYIQIPELNYRIQYLKTPWQTIVPIKFYKLNENKYSHIKYSAVDIIDSYDLIKTGQKPIVNPEEFKDKIVIFGANAKLGNGLNDVKKTPIDIYHSGADMQATAIDNLMHNDFLKILPDWANILITILSMLFVYYTIRTHQLIKAINYTLLTILILILGVSTCFYYGIIANLATPVVMCVMTMIIAYIHRYVIEAKTKEKVENAMGRYMSEDVMKDVIKNIDNLGLGGKKAIVTVLFSDIRGFTSMSENMSAQEVSQLLNEYFSEMEPIVTKYNGIINKFIGDAVMAVFGEPIQDENHAINAVKCGYDMLKKVGELDEKWEKEGKPVIKIGVGINTGEVFVGNIGSEKRMEYTVIGDTVNLASRLESYNKTYKTQILISSATYEKSKDFISVNKISDVEIRGKAERMDIYEVTGVNDDPAVQ
jgi:adenylate cyclase